MAMFATVDDLADRLQTDFDTDDRIRATGLLEDASAVVQRAARQRFELVSGDTAVLLPTHTNLLMLPELPVVDVVSVTVQGNVMTVDTGYLWTSSGLIYAISPARWHFPTTVVYDHGYAQVPDDVRSVVTDIAARAWQNPRGVLSEQIGTYSARYPNNQSGITLLDDELRLVHSYRPKPG